MGLPSIPTEANELPGSNVACETITVRGGMAIADGFALPVLAGCFFIADPGLGGPGYLSNLGFAPFVVNGIGDFTFPLLFDPGSQVIFATTYFATDGVPGMVSVLPLPGVARVLLTQHDGTPVDTGCSLILLRNPNL